MFDEFRRAWREAVENFWRELGADPDDADDADDARLKAVYREVARARSQLDRLGAEIDETRRRQADERVQIDICVRRERLAREINDLETVEVAVAFAARHRERADVLGRKLAALEAERALCRRDLEEMERGLLSKRDAAVEAGLDDLNRHPAEPEFRDLETAARDRAAAERLAEIKRRMGQP